MADAPARPPLHLVVRQTPTQGAKLLASLGKSLGKSQEWIAVELNVSRSHVGHWMRGFRSPSARHRRMMLDRWGVPAGSWDEPVIPAPPLLPTLPSEGSDATDRAPSPTIRVPSIVVAGDELEALCETGQADAETVRLMAAELRAARARASAHDTASALADPIVQALLRRVTETAAASARSAIAAALKRRGEVA